MSASTVQVGRVEQAVRPEGSRRRFQLPRFRLPRFQLRRRHLWLVPGLAIAVYANMLGAANAVGILALLGFGIAPDLPRLLGARGRPMHNLLHQPLAPIVAVAVTATGVVPAVWLVGALVWLGHVVAGRGINDVPRPTSDRPPGTAAGRDSLPRCSRRPRPR